MFTGNAESEFADGLRRLKECIYIFGRGARGEREDRTEPPNKQISPMILFLPSSSDKARKAARICSRVSIEPEDCLCEFIGADYPAAEAFSSFALTGVF